MFSAVESAVAVTQVSRAEFDTGLPFSSLSAAASSLVPAGLFGSVGGDEAPHLRVGQAAGALERVLADDLREGARLGAGRDLLVGPLGCVLRDCRVVGGAEDDLLLLDAVAHRRAAVDAHVDRGDAEGDQHQAGDDATDLE